MFILPSTVPSDAEIAENPEILRTLVAWGRVDTLKQLTADPSLYLDSDENTLLHVAARHAQPESVRFLRETSSLLPTTLNSEGKSPLDIAAALPDGRLLKAETISVLNAQITAKPRPAKKVAKK